MLFICIFRIQVPGEKILVLSDEWDKTPGFKYFGEGLRAGQCGVSINQVKTINHGLVQCFMGENGVEIPGTVPLTVACKYILL